MNALSLTYILRRLDKAYASFFRRIKAKETPGHPRFKGADQFKSIEYAYGDGCKLRFDGKRQILYVQNVGLIKVKFHRPLPVDCEIKHVILKRKASGWYVYLTLEPRALPIPENTLPAVGIDMGLKRLLTLSDGGEIDNPRYLRQSLKELRVAQRKLSRRVKGSNRRKDARQAVTLLHEHVANTRKDLWHKVTTWLAGNYGFIALEKLNLNFMIQNDHLSLSASDAGLGMFQDMLCYKAVNAGIQVVFVNPAYTSQRCSQCQEIVPKELSVRVHSCPHCGLSIDRDLNAAINILNLASESARTEPTSDNVDH